jgi:hypothetical protein
MTRFLLVTKSREVNEKRNSSMTETIKNSTLTYNRVSYILIKMMLAYVCVLYYTITATYLIPLHSSYSTPVN